MSGAEAFFDTNVLIYLLSADVAKADRAEELVAAGGVVSVQVLNEFASVGTRKLGLQLAEVVEILAAVRANCSVVPLDVETHDLGLALAARHRLSIYDSFIVAAAQKSGCKVLYTEDLRDGERVGPLTIHNPFAP